MSDAVDRTRRSYDAAAEAFRERTRDRSVVRSWLERFAGALAPGARVLDLGAGPGWDAAALRACGLAPTLLDLSMGMLRAGGGAGAGPRVQADARRLPFAGARFDGVWANASLLHLGPEDLTRALAEVRRVLRAPGRVHVSVKAGHGAAWESERYGVPRWFQYWTGPELDARLADAGLRIVGAWSNPTSRADWLVRHAVAAPGGGPERTPGGGHPSAPGGAAGSRDAASW